MPITEIDSTRAQHGLHPRVIRMFENVQPQASFQLQQILRASSVLEKFHRDLVESGRKNLYLTGSAIAEIVWNFQLEKDPDDSLDPIETIEEKDLPERLSQAIPAFAVAIKLRAHQIDVIAPFGLKDLFGQRLRPNKKNMTQLEYDTLATTILARWPSVQVGSWKSEDDGGTHGHHSGCCS